MAIDKQVCIHYPSTTQYTSVSNDVPLDGNFSYSSHAKRGIKQGYAYK